jgi:hypothetical protein
VFIPEWPICPISLAGEIYIPQNTLSIPPVENFACLEIEQIILSLRGHQINQQVVKMEVYDDEGLYI